MFWYFHLCSYFQFAVSSIQTVECQKSKSVHFFYSPEENEPLTAHWLRVRSVGLVYAWGMNSGCALGLGAPSPSYEANLTTVPNLLGVSLGTLWELSSVVFWTQGFSSSIRINIFFLAMMFIFFKPLFSQSLRNFITQINSVSCYVKNPGFHYLPGFPPTFSSGYIVNLHLIRLIK